MARNHSVDTSKIQPAQGTGTLVNKANTPLGRFDDLGKYPGNRLASVPPPKGNVPRKPSMTVSNLPAGAKVPEGMPVSPASVYQEPPASVTGSPADASTPPRS